VPNDTYSWNARDAAAHAERQERWAREQREATERAQRQQAQESARRWRELSEAAQRQQEQASSRYRQQAGHGARGYDDAAAYYEPDEDEFSRWMSRHSGSEPLRYTPRPAADHPAAAWHCARLARFREIGRRAEAARPAGQRTRQNAPCPCGSGARFKHCHGRDLRQG
jgi:hypothetical protein